MVFDDNPPDFGVCIQPFTRLTMVGVHILPFNAGIMSGGPSQNPLRPLDPYPSFQEIIPGLGIGFSESCVPNVPQVQFRDLSQPYAAAGVYCAVCLNRRGGKDAVTSLTRR